MKTNKRCCGAAVAWVLALGLLTCGCSASPADTSETAVPPSATEPAEQLETGYICALDLNIPYYDEEGTLLGTLPRGTRVEYQTDSDGRPAIRLEDLTVYLPPEGAGIVSDPADVIPSHTLYVQTAANLRDEAGKLLPAFAEVGSLVLVTGYDYLTDSGEAHMYRVDWNGEEGYIAPWYLTDQQIPEDLLADTVHASRGDRYGGGGALDLDYHPRQKGPIEDNQMPEECRALYLVSWRLDEVDSYLQIAAESGINAFVVDILDGGSIGYAGEVMQEYCPSAVNAAHNTVEEYQTAIQKIRDAGYYVIGRITTFNDTYFVKDHPEYAIADESGNPRKLASAYWPSPYCRAAWQYKVDLAVEAVELMGFHEIQFDYVRFPDNMRRYEKAGTIDFRNTYGETKAQAVHNVI